MYQMSVQDSTGLTTERILHACPAIFALDKHESRSTRYTYISTSDLLDALHTWGFTPTQVMQSRSRVEGKTPFTKHLIRLRHTTELGMARPDVREVVLVNAHDGTSSYQLMQGVFRTMQELEATIVSRRLSVRASAQIDCESGELELGTENGIECYSAEEALELLELLYQERDTLYALLHR